MSYMPLIQAHSYYTSSSYSTTMGRDRPAAANRSRMQKKSIEKARASKEEEKHRKMDQQRRKAMDKCDLQVGDRITNKQGNTWTVVSKIGQGGFGAVYKVECIRHAQLKGVQAAMRVEPKLGSDHRSYLRLNFEGIVLDSLRVGSAQLDKPIIQHFPELMDRGQTSHLKFLVMSLAGPSLDDMRRMLHPKPEDDFKKETVYVIALQALQAIWGLHEIGFVHRDIKPSNFCVGDAENRDLIVMIDFGICRRIYVHTADRDWLQKPPRKRLGFLGTELYCSRNCHEKKEQGRVDDLESWLYMVYDLFDRGSGLPWKKAHRAEIGDVKREFFHSMGGFKSGHRSTLYVPKPFKRIFELLSALHYEDEPDYAAIMHVVEQAAGLDDDKKDGDGGIGGIANAKLEWLGMDFDKLAKPVKVEEELE